jgi:hypothetical protein
MHNAHARRLAADYPEGLNDRADKWIFTGSRRQESMESKRIDGI